MKLGPAGTPSPSRPSAPSSRPPGSPRAAVAMAALAGVVIAVLAARHPHLRFVDAIGFSTRARDLADRLVDPLYPVGYPALLAAAHALGADVLVAAKALSVLAGAGAAAAATLLVGPAGAAWLASQAGVLAWGITEGTDLPAATLALGAIAAASGRRPAVAGVLVGLACLVRYTSVAAVPVVLALEPRAWKGLLVAVSPHFALAAYTGASPLPDQSMNMEIGAGRPTPLFSLDTLARWPGGFARALRDALPDGPTAVSAVGLLLGVRDRRARALLAWALLHCAALGLAFSNTRLALPAQMAFALGAAWLVPWRARPKLADGALAVAAAALFAWNAHLLWRPERRYVDLAEAAAGASHLDGPFLSNSPWFHTRRDGWLVGSRQLSGLGNPRGLTPPLLAERLRETGADAVALEVVRVPGRMPGLAPMMDETPPGFELVVATRQWRVYALASGSPAAPSAPDVPTSPSPAASPTR